MNEALPGKNTLSSCGIARKVSAIAVLFLSRLSTPIQMLTAIPAAAAVDENAARFVAFNGVGL